MTELVSASPSIHRSESSARHVWSQLKHSAKSLLGFGPNGSEVEEFGGALLELRRGGFAIIALEKPGPKAARGA
jgi:hypothetical protein